MNAHRKQLWIAVIPLVLAASMACGIGSLPSIPGLPPKPSLSDQPTGSSPMSGDWNADTDFGHFSFTVDPDGTKVTTAVVEMSGYSCGGTTLSTETQNLSQWPISDNEFSGEVNLGSSDETLYLTFDGSYDAASKTFSGSWEEDTGGESCSGEWETTPHK